MLKRYIRNSNVAGCSVFVAMGVFRLYEYDQEK